MTDIRTQAVSAIAGEVAASGGRPAMQVARDIVARLERQGLAVVHVSQAKAVEALAGLDTILDLQTDDPDLVREWARQMEMEDPTNLFAALEAVREVLDGPKHAEQLAAVFANRPAA